MQIFSTTLSILQFFCLFLLLTQLSSCDKNNNQTHSDEKAPVIDNSGTQDSLGNDFDRDASPFAGKDFGDLTDIKVVPRPVLPATSGGTGGEILGADFSFTSSLDMISEVYVYAPNEAADEPLRLFGFLHGDGSGSLNRATVEGLAKRFNVIAFAASAPDQDSWWNGQGVSKTKHFDEIIANIKSKWNVDNSRLFLTGMSGGSTFLAAIYLPMFSYKQPTTAFILCGGAENLLEEYLWTDVTAQQTKVHIYRAADDFLEQQIQRTIAYYEKKGLLASQQLDKSKNGHCSFSVVEAIAQNM